MFVALAREILPPAAIVLGGTVALLMIGVIDDEEAFAGFSNAAPLTVAALYVLARAAEKTGLLGPLVERLLGHEPRIGRKSLVRLLVPTAGISAFINNTPLVGMLIPEVTSWAARRKASASRLLLPISYAAILGGSVTVIGTSTNLVVSGLLEESGEEPLGLFELTPIGGVSALVGLAVLIGLVPRLLPDRRAVGEDLSEEIREFTLSMEVVPRDRLEGMTVEDAGLRQLEGVYLVEVVRNSQVIAPVGPRTRLRGDDRLTFAGRVDLVVDLQRMRGLRSTEEEHLSAVESPEHTFYEAVIGPASPLVGRTPAQADFRNRYGAAVLAIHRAGETVPAKLGQVTLRSGDTLLLLASPAFRDRWKEGPDFLLVAQLGGPPPSASRKAPLVGVIALAVIALAAFEVVPILHAALLAAAALIATRVLTVAEARDAVDLDVIILIAAAFGIGAAIETTGLAAELAEVFVDAIGPLGDVGIILAIVVATTLITEVITNNAAAAVLFPIAIAVSESAGLDPRTIAIAIAVTASSSFLTPLGYQTNTMVYGPGGYRFTDYLRAGIPVNICVVMAITAMTWALA